MTIAYRDIPTQFQYIAIIDFSELKKCIDNKTGIFGEGLTRGNVRLFREIYRGRRDGSFIFPSETRRHPRSNERSWESVFNEAFWFTVGFILHREDFVQQLLVAEPVDAPEPNPDVKTEPDDSFEM